MGQCPVCDSEYSQDSSATCSVCGWRPEPHAIEQISQDVSEFWQQQERNRIEWARQTWQKLQNAKQTLADRRPDEIRFKYHLVKKLAILEEQFQKATQERSILQRQMDQVISHLKTLDPEKLSQTTARLNTWLDTQETVPLSEVGANYDPLAEQLAAQQWQVADEYTWQLILAITQRQQYGWLRVEDVENFPCTDLRTIDQFWRYYSNGQFGLSVQQGIWEKVAGDYGTFCDQVSWRKGENWKYYEELSFNSSAPPGHLPVLVWRKRACYGISQGTAAECLTSMIYRLKICTPENE
ncbi:MAG: GUN4 domain-containing protein [Microcoleaceae cyanobacterium]